MSGKQFAALVVITFIVGMIWLISDIIFNTKASIEVSPKLETLLSPINPVFNQRVLDQIDKDVVDINLTSPALRDSTTQLSSPAAPSEELPPLASPSPSPSPVPTSTPSPTTIPSISPNGSTIPSDTANL